MRSKSLRNGTDLIADRLLERAQLHASRIIDAIRARLPREECLRLVEEMRRANVADGWEQLSGMEEAARRVGMGLEWNMMRNLTDMSDRVRG